MATCRLGGFNSERKNNTSQDESFCVFNVFCVFISLVTILADLTTDILVLAEYCKNGQIYWALSTLIFMLLPNILINIFSIRWFMIDNNNCMNLWITHCFLVGLIERYIKLLHEVFWCKNFEAIKTQKLMSQRNDLTLLHFLYIFSGTVPQIILQTYAIITLNDNYQTKVFALAASITSVVWGFSTYIYNTATFRNEQFYWIPLLVKMLWQLAMLLGRVPAIFLFTVIFGIWTLVPLGIHWLAMTLWIITQKTNFCPNKLEETMYNVVMGFIYCFSFVNLRDGFTRYRLMMYYTLTISQNFGSLFLYILAAPIEKQKKTWSITATICVVAGNVIGLCAMILFYRFFHSKGPLTWKFGQEDIELNNKDVNTDDKKGVPSHVRSFKSASKDVTEKKKYKISSVSSQISQKETAIIDKNILLEYRNTEFTGQQLSPAQHLGMDVSIEMYTVENTPMSVLEDQTKVSKKVTICSPTELTLKLNSIDDLESSIDEITSNNIIMQKRRGVCSSDDLRNSLRDLNLVTCEIINEEFINTIKTDQISEISQGSNKKTSSDSIDMDLDLSFSDINSSDINTFNENIVQKLCLSALKNIKVGNQDADIENIQRIALDILKEMYTKKDRRKNLGNNDSLLTRSRDLDTPTEMLSVHDYENICAVNIAREAWGIRSWNGYSDIENWLHDGSVVRDRSRDTFTSASSEISSCLSHELKNAILAAPAFPKRSHTYSNVFIKPERFNQGDYVNTEIYQTNDPTLGKPFNIENGKDSIHLEPILEELDDLGDIDLPRKKRLNSESSLVATIDEIRKATITNSPRNIYRRELSWDSPQLNTCNKIDLNLKKALWKEPMKINSSNIMKSLPEKENMLCIPCDSNAETVKKDLNFDKMSFDGPRKETRKLKAQAHLQDLSNKDIDFLWQLVTDHSLSFSSNEDLSSNRMSTSLQSLIQRETPTSLVTASTAKINNIIKVTKIKPRRKLSVLREKFEPRTNSDEEILYNQNSSSDDIHTISQKKQLDGVYARKSNEVHLRHVPDLLTIQKSKESRVSYLKQMSIPPKLNSSNYGNI